MAAKRHRVLRSILFGLLVFYLGWLALLFFTQRRMLFPTGGLDAQPFPEGGIEGIERLLIQTDQGQVEAWFIRGDGVSADHPGPAVIFCHGNAELIDHWPVALGQYPQWGVSLLLPEYRGYGRSAGQPSQEAIGADLIRFYDLLAARPEVDRARIVFHGRSLGGGVACALAAARAPRALILQSTFASVSSMAWSMGAPPFLVRDPFDNLAVLEGLEVPVLIFHGRDDELIPFSNAERMARAAKQARLVPLACGHNDCPPDIHQYWLDLAVFLGQAGVLAPVSEK